MGKTRVQTCATCRNHGVISKLKGHKRYCRYQNCRCRKCLLTRDRRQVMSQQIKLRRYQQQDEQHGIRTLITEEELSRNDQPALSPPLSSNGCQMTNPHQTNDSIDREMNTLNLQPPRQNLSSTGTGYTSLTDISRSRTIPASNKPLLDITQSMQRESLQYNLWNGSYPQDPMRIPSTDDIEGNRFLSFLHNTGGHGGGLSGGLTGGLTSLWDGGNVGRIPSWSGESSPSNSIKMMDARN